MYGIVILTNCIEEKMTLNILHDALEMCEKTTFNKLHDDTKDMRMCPPEACLVISPPYLPYSIRRLFCNLKMMLYNVGRAFFESYV
jgi:hypothetical protein